MLDLRAVQPCVLSGFGYKQISWEQCKHIFLNFCAVFQKKIPMAKKILKQKLFMHWITLNVFFFHEFLHRLFLKVYSTPKYFCKEFASCLCATKTESCSFWVYSVLVSLMTFKSCITRDSEHSLSICHFQASQDVKDLSLTSLSLF